MDTTPPIGLTRALLVAFLAASAAACQAYDHAAYDRLRAHGPGDASNVACEAGLPTCGTRCVDLLRDPLDCGRCGHTCAAGEACLAGACTADAGSDGAVTQGDADADAADAGLDATPDVAPGIDVVQRDTQPTDVQLPDVQRPDVQPDVPAVAVPPGFRNAQSVTLSAGSGCCLTINRPAGALAGQLFVASIMMGVSGATTLPTMTAPSGWTLVRRTDHAVNLSLWTFWHVAGAIEPSSYTFTTDHSTLGGGGWIASYAGVDTSHPIDAEAGQDLTASTTTYTAPSITTTVAQDLVVVTIAGRGGSMASWVAPTGMVTRVNISDGTTRSGLDAEEPQPAPGPTGVRTLTATMTQDYAVVEVFALTPVVH